MVMNQTELERARSYFSLDDGLVFLNHASHSPLPVPSRAIYDRYLDSWQRTAHAHDAESFRIIEEVRSKLGRLTNAPEDRIGLSSGTSFGFNIVAQGLRWESGDNVIVSRCDFPAVVYPWIPLKEKGVELKFADCENGFTEEDKIISLIDKQTRVIAVSWVQFYNGNRLDLKKLGDICRQNDILLCVDGIQGMGVVPIDLSALNIDLFTCGCQKWMLGPCGTGFFYLSERAEERLGIPYYGWLSVDWKVDFSNLLRYNLLPRKGPSKFEISTYAYQDIRALDASLDILLSFDHKTKWDYVFSLTDSIVKAVDSDSRYSLASRRERERRSGILNIRPENPHNLHEYLSAKNIIVSLREGGIRVSPHFYNTPEEVEKFIAALADFPG